MLVVPDALVCGRYWLVNNQDGRPRVGRLWAGGCHGTLD